MINDKHDVLLVNPVVGPEDLYVTPYHKLSVDRQIWFKRLTRIPQGLLSIASWLKQHGYTTKIFDSRLHLLNGGSPTESLINDLRKEVENTRLFVGLSVLTMHIPQALMIAGLIRKVNNALPIIWGGVHPTLYPQQTIKDNLCDCVVIGDGEVPCLQIAKNPSAYTKKVVESKPFNPNMLETPFYDALNFSTQDFNVYLKRHSFNPNEEVRGIEYNGSRGCSFNCAFCINSVVPQNKIWRARTAKKVYEDLCFIKKRFDVEYVFFEEEFPFLNHKRNAELIKLLSPLKLKFYANMRADYISKTASDELLGLRDMGWRETSVGAESGSDRVLKFLNKNVTVNDLTRTSHVLNMLDVYALYSFMTDLPTETNTEKLATFTLMRKLKANHKKCEFIGPQTYREYPATPWHRQRVLNGEVKEPQSLREWVTSGLSDFYAQ